MAIARGIFFESAQKRKTRRNRKMITKQNIRICTYNFRKVQYNFIWSYIYINFHEIKINVIEIYAEPSNNTISKDIGRQRLEKRINQVGAKF